MADKYLFSSVNSITLTDKYRIAGYYFAFKGVFCTPTAPRNTAKSALGEILPTNEIYTRKGLSAIDIRYQQLCAKEPQ
jgi:hypothetical protein